MRMKFRFIANIILVGIILFLGIRIIEERVLLKRYIEQLEQKQNISKPYSSNDIIEIRDYILSDIDFKSGDIAPSRPKIGWTVRKIIKKRQGLCGEGSRLLFHILKCDDIKSRRIYLHGNNTLHVIIEYLNSSGDWQLLETINGPGKNFRNRMDNNLMSVDSLFNFGPYRFHVTPTDFAKKYDYLNFSYLPLNGIFNNAALKTEVYVHRPMPAFINYFLERHEFFLAIIFMIAVFIINAKQITLLIKRFINKGKI